MEKGGPTRLRACSQFGKDSKTYRFPNHIGTRTSEANAYRHSDIQRLIDQGACRRRARPAADHPLHPLTARPRGRRRSHAPPRLLLSMFSQCETGKRPASPLIRQAGPRPEPQPSPQRHVGATAMRQPCRRVCRPGIAGPVMKTTAPVVAFRVGFLPTPYGLEARERYNHSTGRDLPAIAAIRPAASRANPRFPAGVTVTVTSASHFPNQQHGRSHRRHAKEQVFIG